MALLERRHQEHPPAPVLTHDEAPPSSKGPSPPASPPRSPASFGRAPAEELREFQALLEAHEEAGGLQAGGSYFLVSHKWLSNWRQWVGQPSVPRPPRRRTLSGDGPRAGHPPSLDRASSEPSAPSSPQFPARPAPAWGGASASASAPTSPALGPAGAVPEFSLQGLDDGPGAGPGGHGRVPSWTKERPGPIDNVGLVDDAGGSSAGLLRPGLRERFDFEVVPGCIWRKLEDWYGGGPAICRTATRQPSGEVQVEVYGTRLRLRLAGAAAAAASEAVVELPRSRSLADLAAEARAALRLPPERRLRLWRRAEGHRPELLGDDAVGGEEPSLEALHLLEDQELLVELEDAAGRWPLEGSLPSSAPRPLAGGPVLEAAAGLRPEGPAPLAFSPPPRPPLDAVEEAPSEAGASQGSDGPEDASASWRPGAANVSMTDSPEELADEAPASPAPAGEEDEELPSPQDVTHSAGIENLTNTCFMNSSLQCLGHIEELRSYFLSGAYREDLEKGGNVTETTKGDLARGFDALLQKLWSGRRQALAPWAFKELVAKFVSGFDGYRQHDCMEFIEYLIDGLKEDCNRVKGKKLYVERADSNGRPDAEVALEAANKFLLRNDSVIDDLFVGFLKSSTECPEPGCRHESVVFDPFLSLKVPLQSAQQLSESTFAVTAFGAGKPVSECQKLTVSVKKYGTAALLVEAAAKAAGFEPSRCLLVELFKDSIYKFFEATDALSDIAPADILVLYELEHPEAFQLSTEKRWGAGEGVQTDDLVEVVADAFWTNSQSSHKLIRGTCGLVLDVDADGDASIQFDGIHEPQWVFKDSLGVLRTDLHMSSAERRVSLADGEEWTLSELVAAWRGQRLLRDIRDYWINGMKPVVAGDQEPRSGVFVFFRREPSLDNPHAERAFFGAPVVFDVPRQHSGRQLAAAASRALARVLGEAEPRAWELYKASHLHVLASACVPLVEPGQGDDGAEDEEADAGWLREREYLVVDWPAEAPPELRLQLLRATPKEPEEQDAGEQAVRLADCFGWLTEREQLSELDSVFCSKCKDHRQMFKKVDLWCVPPVLVLQLKRFAGEDMRQRLSTPVNFPLEGLDLTEYCLTKAASFPSSSCVRAGQRVRIRGLASAAGQKLNGQEGLCRYLDSASGRYCVQLAPEDEPPAWKRLKPENLDVSAETAGAEPEAIFDLLSLCKHIGDQRFGHYVAYARSTVDGRWRLYDDESVTVVPPEEVARQRIGAYVLFYLRRDRRPASWTLVDDV